MLFVILTIALLVPYCILLLYYRKSWMDIKEYVALPLPGKTILPYVSVIIAARNEAGNIGQCIESLLAQTYPVNRFEIIIINDYSTDNTVEIIRGYQRENIRVINLEDYTKDHVLNS